MSIKTKGLDHMAIAVKDLDRAIALYQGTFGLKLVKVEDVPEQQVRVAIFGEGLGRVELICPTTPDSGVARFLEKRGEGIHHMCLAVEDLEEAIAHLKSEGAQVIDERPKIGAGGAKVAFVHPKTTGGILVELHQGGHDALR